MKSNSYNTFSVSFYCREAKKNRQGMAPIEVSIVSNGRRWIIALPRKENPSTFVSALKSKRNNSIKDYLEGIREKISDAQNVALKQGKVDDIALFRAFVLHGGLLPATVSEMFDEYFEILKRRVGVNLTQRTFRKFELSRDKFYTVISPDAPAMSIDETTIQILMTELQRDYEYQTVMGYASKIKTVLLYGIKKHYIPEGPFGDIHIRKWNKEVQFLTEDELGRIKDFKTVNRSLERVRDMFIFQANSGLSFADLSSLRSEDFQVDGNGQYYIEKPRVKTGVPYIAVILPDGVEIARKYGFNLPVISNQKTNSYLKVIQDLCGISKPLHTHIARHTYATRCINAGVRLEVVAKLLGHTNTTQTRHYAKLLNKSIVDEVSNCFIHKDLKNK